MTFAFVAKHGVASNASEYLFGFLMTLVAGLATCLGVAFIPILRMGEGAEKRMTSAALAFAAGVMIYVSFVDVLGEEAKEYFEQHFVPDVGHHGGEDEHSHGTSVRIAIAAFFFLGLLLALAMDLVVGHEHSEHDHGHGQGHSQEQDQEHGQKHGQDLEHQMSQSYGSAVGAVVKKSLQSDGSSLERVSLVAFLALTMHNFPEGLATFFSSYQGTWKIPVAIAVHNIPEGAAIAIPHYQATGDFTQTFIRTFLAGLAQPVGAAVGWLLLVVMQITQVPSFAYGAMYAATAGIMVAVSLTELIPEALQGASPTFVAVFVFSGFFVMELSIIFLSLVGGEH